MTDGALQDLGMPTSTELIEAHASWLRSRYAENTVDDARRFLLRLDRELPYGLPTALFDELETWLDQNPAWSAQTRETYRLHIRRFFKWGTRPAAPRLSADPSLGLERYNVPRGIPRPATDAQVRWCVVEAAMPWRVFCTMTAYAGIRPFEVARIAQAPHDYITEQATAIIRGKGGKSRIVPTHPDLWAAIRDLPNQPIATRRDGRPIDPDWVSKNTAQYLRNHSPWHHGLSLYNLRHWYGTEVQEAAGDSRVTQEAMGHASLTSTQVYTLITNSRLRAAITSLPSFTDRG